MFAQILNNESQRKRLNCFKTFIFVDGDNTFHITKFTTINAAISSYQTILLYALHSEVWSCVWIGNSSKSSFLHRRDLEFRDSRDLQNFPPLYPEKFQESCVFLFLSKVFTLYSSKKNVWKLTVIKTSAVPHNSVQVSCATKRLFCGFVLFWRAKWVPLNFAINKNSQFL